MMGYIHYRVVQPEFYLPLEMFKGSKHLTSVMLDTALGAFLTSSFVKSPPAPTLPFQPLNMYMRQGFSTAASVLGTS